MSSVHIIFYNNGWWYGQNLANESYKNNVHEYNVLFLDNNISRKPCLLYMLQKINKTKIYFLLKSLVYCQELNFALHFKFFSASKILKTYSWTGGKIHTKCKFAKCEIMHSLTYTN